MRFCIVGTGRCGSTLLRRMTNHHPGVFVFPETHWIPKMFEVFGTGRGSVDALISIVRRTFHVTGRPVTKIPSQQVRARLREAEEGGATVREFCDALGTIFAASEGKVSWADKTPDYGPHMELLQRLWPDCRFVHLVRDPFATAASMAGHPGYRWLVAAEETWWCPAAFNRYYSAVHEASRPRAQRDRAFLDLWLRRFERIRDEATRLKPGSLIEVRFSDLVREPHETLTSVCDFLGLSLGSWADEAVAEVDVSRIRSRPGARPIDLLDASQRRRLLDLGFAASEVD